MLFPVDYVKQLVDVKDCAFIETGTYKGDSTKLALKAGFAEIHSIELNPSFANAARQRFSNKVRIWQGDTKVVLPKVITIVNKSKRRCVFWLDAHGVAKNPLANRELYYPLQTELDELRALDRKDSIICIDDVHMLEKCPGLSSLKTHEEKREVLKQKLLEVDPNFKVEFPDVGYIKKLNANNVCVAYRV